MTPERFRALVEAYGADPRRWPEGEREAALGAVQPALIDEARALDALLDAAPRPEISHGLRERVIASAAEAGLKAGRTVRFWRDRLVWALGAGWAAAACAGVIAGVALTQQLTADLQGDAALYQASLGLEEGLIG